MGQVDQVQFGRTTITYAIVRSDHRETVSVTVNPDATVTVRVPKGIRRKRIADKVAAKAEWIVGKQDQIHCNGRRMQRKLVSGESLPYLGRHYQLKIQTAPQRDALHDVTLTGGQFRVVIPRSTSNNERQDYVRRLLRQWYRTHAEARLRDMTNIYARRLGVQFEQIQIYEMRSRWGSGGPSGRLRFNWRTIIAPRKLVAYVVAHELCHIRHGQHSTDFWRMLETVMPDYRKRRAELAHIGPRLDVWSLILMDEFSIASEARMVAAVARLTARPCCPMSEPL